jgi:hypothetical protein
MRLTREILIVCAAAFPPKTVRFSRGNGKADGQKIRAGLK